MQASFTPPIAAWLRASSGVAVAAGLLMHGTASAQTAVPAPSVDEKKAAEIVDPSRPGAAEERAGDKGEIIVTGSRIQRAGFNAPTPTTVLGDIELREGNPVSIGQVLNDSPAFRSTSNPATTTGDISPAAKLWVDGSFTRVTSNFPFFPTTPFLSVQADNAFLTPTAKSQLAALGHPIRLRSGASRPTSGRRGIWATIPRAAHLKARCRSGSTVQGQAAYRSGNVNNLFNRDPPYVTHASPTYDMIGRYCSAGVNFKC